MKRADLTVDERSSLTQQLVDLTGGRPKQGGPRPGTGPKPKEGPVSPRGERKGQVKERNYSNSQHENLNRAASVVSEKPKQPRPTQELAASMGKSGSTVYRDLQRAAGKLPKPKAPSKNKVYAQLVSAWAKADTETRELFMAHVESDLAAVKEGSNRIRATPSSHGASPFSPVEKRSPLAPLFRRHPIDHLGAVAGLHPAYCQLAVPLLSYSFGRPAPAAVKQAFRSSQLDFLRPAPLAKVQKPQNCNTGELLAEVFCIRLLHTPEVPALLGRHTVQGKQRRKFG